MCTARAGAVPEAQYLEPGLKNFAPRRSAGILQAMGAAP